MRALVTLLALSLLAPAARGQPRKASDPDAKIAYYRARAAGPTTYPAYARLGLAYAEKARLTGQATYSLEAARELERSLAMQRSYEALLGLAGVSLALHRFPESRAYAREALDTAPGDPAAKGALFDAELALGQLDEAAKLLERMPADSFGRLVRTAALHEYRGNVAAARSEVERACALPEIPAAPPGTRAWCEVRIGALYVASCQPEEARAHYARALAIVPGFVMAREHVAELDAAEGKTAEAVALYRGLVAAVADPRHSTDLAALYDTAGRRQDAARERRRARAELLQRAEQGIRDGWHELALLEADDPSTVASAVRWAEQDWQNRQDARAGDALAWALLQHGDAEKAAAVIEGVLASGGSSPAILLHASAIRLQTGHPGEADALYARAVECPVALTPSERWLSERLRSEVAQAAAASSAL